MAALAERLHELGKRANKQELTQVAAALFEASYAVGGRLEPRISAANMRLRMGQAELARAEYERLLSMGWQLDEKVREIVLRKRAEADGLIDSGMHVRHVTWPPGAPEMIQDVSAELLRGVVEELSQHGARANREGRVALARDVYMAAFALSGRISMRISAANMSFKLSEVEAVHFALSEYDAILGNVAGGTASLSSEHMDLVEHKRAAAVAWLKENTPGVPAGPEDEEEAERRAVLEEMALELAELAELEAVEAAAAEEQAQTAALAAKAAQDEVHRATLLIQSVVRGNRARAVDIAAAKEAKDAAIAAATTAVLEAERLRKIAATEEAERLEAKAAAQDAAKQLARNCVHPGGSKLNASETILSASIHTRNIQAAVTLQTTERGRQARCTARARRGGEGAAAREKANVVPALAAQDTMARAEAEA
eukprot:scaffold75526_cov31-Tisochrysis_lutea.AAC.1